MACGWGSAFAATVLLAGCAPPPEDAQHPITAALMNAAELELLTIEAGAPSEWSTGALDSHRVLGRVAVDPGARGHLITTLDSALDPQGKLARCFTPRHALVGRTNDAVTVEVIVCLECHAIRATAPGIDGLVPMVAKGEAFAAVEGAIEAIRRDAGLPLAP